MAHQLSKISKYLPSSLIALWSLLLLVNFISLIPQPSTIIGYLWKVELALAGLISLALVTALWVPRKNLTNLRFSSREFYRIILPILFFVVWSGLSILWAESSRNALHHTLLWACYALFYILVRQVAAHPRLLDFSLKISALVITVIGIACIIEYANSYPKVTALFTFRYYKYAEASVMLLPLYLAVALRAKKQTAWLAGAVAVIAWLVILLSYSRTELIAGTFCAGLFFALIAIFQDFKKYRRRLIVLFFALLIPAIITQTSILKSEDSSTMSRFTASEENQKNLQWRFMIWGISLESFKTHPWHGIGADNFVTNYRNALESYAQTNSENKLLELDQHVIAERSHNEFAQILSELGIVGALIFGSFLLGISSFLFALRRRKVSPFALAAFAGIAAFFISSLTSSYSFRVPANGVCFFFLLALAAREFFKHERPTTTGVQSGFDFLKLKPVFIGGGVIITVATIAFSTMRGVSLMYLQNALESQDKAVAEENFRHALNLDAQEPSFRYYYGMYLSGGERVAEAVPHIRLGIDRGLCTSITYFDLASAQITAGQTSEAEKTYAEALRVFPRSVFLRTAYSAFLKENGKEADAENEFQKALQINPKQAESWQIAQTEGMETLTKAGIYNKNLLPVMSLQPNDGVYALVGFQARTNPSLVQRKF